MKNSIVFSEKVLAGHSLKNAIVYLPVGLGAIDTDTDGTVVGQERLNHYLEIAKGGVGMIIVEATMVVPDFARCYPIMPGTVVEANQTMLGIYTVEQVKCFKKLVELCKQENVLMLLQLAYSGLDAPLDDRLLSDWSAEKMKELADAFVQAAYYAKQAGFDGIELHAAHGLFLSQVLSPVVNDRQDEYGGTVEQRTNYITTILKKIKQTCGDQFITGVRMGCNEPDLTTGIKIARLLEAGGADFLDISSGINNSAYIGLDRPAEFPYSKKMYAAWKIHQEVKIPVIGVEGIRIAEQALDVLEKDYVSLIGVGRAILADYQWPNKVIAGIEPNYCKHCIHCQWYDNHTNCPARK